MQKNKWLQLILCCGVFGVMALGSGSDSSDDSVASSSDSADQTSQSQSDEKVSIEEQVLLDDSGVKITATEYGTDSLWGDYIQLQIENNTDQDLMFGCEALIVNDYNISDLFAAQVAAGKKSNEKLYLSSSQLKAAGIDQVGQVEIYFHIYDNDTWDTLLDTDDIVIKTSLYDSMDTSSTVQGTELYNENGIKIVAAATDEDSFWGASILLYIENNSGQNVEIQADNMSVNGYMMTPYFSTTVYDGKKAIDDITLMSSELEENDIDSIDEVELEFEILDADTFMTISESGPITFSVNE